MELPLDGALQFLDQIMEIQKEIDEVNEKEYNAKLKLRDELEDKLRWDEKNGCLRHPHITQSQQCLFDERREHVKLIPDFWATALFGDGVLVDYYMNEEERKLFKKYLKSVDVIYHGNAKSGYTIELNMDANPYFENNTLTKTFRFCRKGFSSESGTAIRWKKDKDIESFAEKEGTQSNTDKPSFFKWFREGSEKLRDLVAEEIVMDFWPNAHEYYFYGKDRCAGETLEVDITGTLSKLTTIKEKLQAAERQATKERQTMQMEYDLVLVNGEREVHKECESLRGRIYDRRSKIIKNIDHFWLIAFLSHYALHLLLNMEDLMILKFLNSVNVKETEDEEGVMSGYTITLNFGENPYFKNETLTKNISYTVISEDPLKDYSDCQVKVCVSNIQWKDGKDITTRNQKGFTDADRSFFTWFCDLGCVEMEAYDEVANLIKQDFWPNAGKYFVNGNLNDEKEVDFAGIHKIEYFTSSLRAFYL
ncbi:hypothetical protein MKW94_027781 [Papaver nudicaule]|uniref:Uncharacterized protein n=1 Tax=Papaver nudicaule TaxID=74823 RepID=A0AA41VQ21_PAPNU|nr:hypothetical protein [Papaver nudicaule]